MTERLYEIVPAQPEDAYAIQIVRAEGWYEQYGSLPGIDAAWIDGQISRIKSAASVGKRAKAIAESSNPDARDFCRVARLALGNKIVGFVDARKLDDRGQEVHSIHIADGYRGQGIGQALMDAAHMWFDPRQPAFLDVAQGNHRAQAFYKRKSNKYTPAGYIYNFEQLGMMRMERRAHA
jgi:ribosomal protein S18 acetylase RimI-like enzyme